MNITNRQGNKLRESFFFKVVIHESSPNKNTGPVSKQLEKYLCKVLLILQYDVFSYQPKLHSDCIDVAGARLKFCSAMEFDKQYFLQNRNEIGP